MEVRDERKEGAREKVKSSGFFKKLKGIKNIQLIVAIFIIAVALLIYSTVATGKAASSVSGTESGSSSVMDDEERRLAAILGGIEGAGRVETMITRRDDEVVGVLVIAEGADDIKVMLKLLEATTTAMGVDKSIVDVYTMK